MLLQIAQFKGLSEKVDPRILKEEYATYCRNCEFESGAVAPAKGHLVKGQFPGYTGSFYQWREGEWLSWPERGVDVARVPTPYDDSLWFLFTGTTAPMQSRIPHVVGGSGRLPNVSYRVGVPAPSSVGVVVDGEVPPPPGYKISEYPDIVEGFVPVDWEPSLEPVVVGTDAETGEDVIEQRLLNHPGTAQIMYETRYYAITYVNAWGQEGPPVISDPVVVVDRQSTSLSFPSHPYAQDSAKYALFEPTLTGPKGMLPKVRIYRSNSGSADTAFQFLAEQSIASSAYTDTKPNDELAEVLPSLNWIGPPDDDLSRYNTGQMLGINALPSGAMVGFSGNTLVYSVPYLSHAYPYTYPVKDEIVGLVPTTTGVLVVTTGRPVIALGLDPQAIVLQEIDEVRACASKESIVDAGEFAVYASFDGLVGLERGETRLLTDSIFTREQWQRFKPETIQAAFFKGRYIAAYDSGAFSFDLSTGDFTELDGEFTALHYSAMDDQLYAVRPGGEYVAFGAADGGSFVWRSKVFQVPHPAVFSAMQVHANGYPVDVTITKDGRSSRVYTVQSDEPIRLEPGRAHTLQFEISSSHAVLSVAVGQSVSEVADA
jgi:hypothetical protein